MDVPSLADRPRSADRKARERAYFRNIGDEGLSSSLRKPFVGADAGRLLSEIGAVLTLLPNAPARIIDYGCGTGWTSHFLAQQGYDVLGLDLSPEAVDAARRSYDEPNLRFEVQDFDGAPESTSCFGAALFFDALHHADDEAAPLEHALSVLEPGGLLVLCEPGVGHASAPASIEAVRRYGVNERDMPPRQIIRAALEVGFVKPCVYPHPHVLHGMYREKPESARWWRFGRTLARAGYAVLYQHRWGVVTLRKPH